MAKRSLADQVLAHLSPAARKARATRKGKRAGVDAVILPARQLLGMLLHAEPGSGFVMRRDLSLTESIRGTLQECVNAAYEAKAGLLPEWEAATGAKADRLAAQVERLDSVLQSLIAAKQLLLLLEPFIQNAKWNLDAVADSSPAFARVKPAKKPKRKRGAK